LVIEGVAAFSQRRKSAKVKITHVDKWQVLVPIRDGILESRGRFAPQSPSDFTAPKWIVRVYSDDGWEGLGESWRGESEKAIDAGISALLGQDPRKLPMADLQLLSRSAYTTFEMALFDLLGHYWGVPAYQLLGGTVHKEIAISAWAYRHSPETFAEVAGNARESGFQSIKFKTTFADPPSLITREHTAEVLIDDPVVESAHAIAAACGHDFSMTIDANGRLYELERAIEVARALEGLNVVLEDPISWEQNLGDYAVLRDASPVPIAVHIASKEAMSANVAGGALGYPVHSSSSALLLDVIKSGAADCVNLGGSMADFVRLAWLAGEAGLACWHESGLDLGIRDASYVHASFAAPNCTIAGDMIGNVLRADDLIKDPILIVGGAVNRPNAPGLGVSLDDEALARFRIDQQSQL